MTLVYKPKRVLVSEALANSFTANQLYADFLLVNSNKKTKLVIPRHL